MTRTLVLSLLACLAAAPACAFIDTSEIDPRTRAKLVREKLRMHAVEQQVQRSHGATPGDPFAASCGSQEIGVIDTQGRRGPMPREVIVYAPNAINIVSAKCPR